VVLLSVTLNGIDRSRQYAEGATAVRGPWEERFLGLRDSVDSGQEVLTQGTGDFLNEAVKADLVLDPRIRDALPDRPASDQGRLDAEGLFMVAARARDYDLFRAAYVNLEGFDRPAEAGPGCHKYTATSFAPVIELATGTGNEIGVTSEATHVKTQLVRGDLRSGERTWDVPANGSLHIASTARDALLRMTFDAGGSYVICKQ
jgi:hypothetical protein